MEQRNGGIIGGLGRLNLAVKPVKLSHLKGLFGNFHGGLLSYGINSGPLIVPFPVPIPHRQANHNPVLANG